MPLLLPLLLLHSVGDTAGAAGSGLVWNLGVWTVVVVVVVCGVVVSGGSIAEAVVCAAAVWRTVPSVS